MATSPTILRAVFPGYTVLRDSVGNGTAEKDVMTGPCRVYSVNVNNNDASLHVWLRLYDSLDPTVGTTDPDYIFRIPLAADKTNMSLGFPEPLVFSVGLSFALVALAGTAGTTAPSANSPVTIVAREGVS